MLSPGREVLQGCKALLEDNVQLDRLSVSDDFQCDRLADIEFIEDVGHFFERRDVVTVDRQQDIAQQERSAWVERRLFQPGVRRHTAGCDIHDGDAADPGSTGDRAG